MARKRTSNSGGWYGDSRGHADAGHQAHEHRLQTAYRRLKWKICDLYDRVMP